MRTLMRTLMRVFKPASQDGFTVIEVMVAMGMLFVASMGLLASLGTGVRNVSAGKQRTSAVALANEVMEQARGFAYANVGHDFSTLVADANITGAPLAPVYTGTSEPLAQRVAPTPALAAGEDPFSPHLATGVIRDQTSYTRAVYVTAITPAVVPPATIAPTPYRRITVQVTWASATATGLRNVTVSSYIYPVGQPADPYLNGVAYVSAGSVTVTRTSGSPVNWLDLATARISFPAARAEVDSKFVRNVNGSVEASQSEISLDSSAIPDATLSNCAVDGSRAFCPATSLATSSVADNDNATSPTNDNAGVAPLNHGGGDAWVGTLATNGLVTRIGATMGSDLSSMSATNICATPAVGSQCTLLIPDALAPTVPATYDDLPYSVSRFPAPSIVPDGFSMPFSFGNALNGSLASSQSVPTVEVISDRDNIFPVQPANQRLGTRALVRHPAIDIVTFAAQPVGKSGFAGMVRVDPTNVTVAATAGRNDTDRTPVSNPPTLTAAAIPVRLYNFASDNYTTVNVTPGTPCNPCGTAIATMSVSGLDVVLTATVTSADDALVRVPLTGPVFDSAVANATDWLVVTVRVEISNGGTPIADLQVVLNYGQLSATTSYVAPPS